MYKDTTGVVGGEGLESQGDDWGGDRSVGDRKVRLPTAQSCRQRCSTTASWE